MGLVVWRVVGGLRKRGWRIQEEGDTPPATADLPEVVTATQETCCRIYIMSSVSVYSSATM